MLVLLMLAGATLSACTPAPEPTPTPTAAFASEEEAFAAAEEVYRAYLAASSQIDTRDPKTFEPVFELTTGGVNKSDRESFSTMNAEKLDISGTTDLLTFEGTRAEPPYDEVGAQVCLDVSDVTVRDEDGNSRVSPDRPDVYALSLTFSADGDRLLLSSSKKSDDASCS